MKALVSGVTAILSIFSAVTAAEEENVDKYFVGKCVETIGYSYAKICYGNDGSYIINGNLLGKYTMLDGYVVVVCNDSRVNTHILKKNGDKFTSQNEFLFTAVRQVRITEMPHYEEFPYFDSVFYSLYPSLRKCLMILGANCI